MLVNPDAWNGRRVFVTGHTGFKGGWLALWLHQMGAEVTGYALPAPTNPSFFEQTGLAAVVNHIEGDVRDAATLEAAIRDAKPEVVLHLAAQPLVRPSYVDPVETYATNVMGTVHLLDACRRIDSVKAILCVTSDKCYENREWVWPYRENDPMGGHDPYSSSKGAAEIAVSSMRRSFFNDGALVASARAGNVIGGGDYAEDRLVPDIVRAMLSGAEPELRSPGSVRPWQHVLDALSGYLVVAQRLLEGDRSAADGWNFGPVLEDTRPVGWIAEALQREWGRGGFVQSTGPQPHEACLLTLDCSKARSQLGWRPTLSLGEALPMVANWHKAVDAGENARDVSLKQLEAYQEKARMGFA